MARWYVDYLNGNNANAGTSWALAKKDVNGVTAALLSQGDSITVAKTQDPISIGNALWDGNDTSTTVTLGTAYTKLIDNTTSGWVAAPNASVTYDVNTRKSTLIVTPATAFTTGKLCYKALPLELDLSSYQQVSCWIGVLGVGALPANIFKLCLCSDTVGDVIVDEFIVPAIQGYTAGRVIGWNPAVLNKASALGSSIKSIAVYAISDPGLQTIRFENIFAALAESDSNCITLRTLIGNGSGFSKFYGIDLVEDNVVTLGRQGGHQCHYQNNHIYYSPFSDANGTYSTYICRPAILTSNFQIQEPGQYNNPITVTGGWNTSTDSIDGFTWLDFMPLTPTTQYYATSPATSSSYLGGVNMKNFGFVRTSSSGWYFGTTFAWNVEDCAMIMSDGGISLGYTSRMSFKNIVVHSSYTYVAAGMVTFAGSPSNYITFTDCYFSSSQLFVAVGLGPSDCKFVRCKFKSAVTFMSGAASPGGGTTQYPGWGTNIRFYDCDLLGSFSQQFGPGTYSWEAYFNGCRGVNFSSIVLSTTYTNGLQGLKLVQVNTDNQEDIWKIGFYCARTYHAQSIIGFISDPTSAGLDSSWNYPGTTTSVVFDPRAAWAPSTIEFRVPVTSGISTNISFYVRKNTALTTSLLKVSVLDAGGSQDKLIDQQSIVLSEAWAKVDLGPITPTYTGFVTLVFDSYVGASQADAGGLVGLANVTYSPRPKIKYNQFNGIGDLMIPELGAPIVSASGGESISLSVG